MKSFWATARMCAREKGYFGLGWLVGQYLMKGAGVFMLAMLWHVLLNAGAVIEGLSYRQAVAYTLVSGALEPLLNVRTPASSWLNDGTILSLYLRPRGLMAQLAAHTVGGWLMSLGLFSLPLLIGGALAGVDLRPAGPWFFVSLPLCVLQGFAVDFLFACLLIRMRNLEWVVHSLREALTALLTGALIPFAALPWNLGKILSLTPLGTLAGAPLALYTGLDSAARLIGAQLLWTVLLWPLAVVALIRSRERMVSYGG